jgi:hypothetical protein
VDQEQDVVRLLFSEQERDMRMDVGFRGHPALGAAALSLLPLFKQDPLWNEFCTTLKGEEIPGSARGYLQIRISSLSVSSVPTSIQEPPPPSLGAAVGRL